MSPDFPQPEAEPAGQPASEEHAAAPAANQGEAAPTLPPAPAGPQPAFEIIPGKTEQQARAWYHEKLEHHKEFTDTVYKLICQLLDDRRILIVDVIPRVKKLGSFLGKLQRKQEYRDFLECEDMCGCRIICVTSAQIEEVRSVIEEQFHATEQFWREPEEGQFGYRSYHMMVELSVARKALPENERFRASKCELQIRTAFQEAWSALDHKVAYKPEANTDPEIKRAIQRMAALVELADKEWEAIYKKVWGGGAK